MDFEAQWASWERLARMIWPAKAAQTPRRTEPEPGSESEPAPEPTRAPEAITRFGFVQRDAVTWQEYHCPLCLAEMRRERRMLSEDVEVVGIGEARLCPEHELAEVATDAPTRGRC